MNAIEIIDQLKANLRTFTCLLENCTEQQIKYRPDPLQWCLLEVVCHLADEEVLDFRTRCLQTLQDPKVKWPAIDPQGWVASRKYMDQNFSTKVAEFLLERKNSIGLPPVSSASPSVFPARPTSACRSGCSCSVSSVSSS